MNTIDYLLIFGGCLGVLIWVIYLLLPNKNKKREQTYDAAEISDTSNTKALSNAESAKLKPTPATAAKSSNWAWLIVGILAIVFVIWVIAPMITKTNAPTPQATAPQKQLEQRVITRNLKFVGGEAIERQGFIAVKKDGRAFYAIHDMPWRRDAIFRVVVCLRQESTGNIILKINGGRGGQKFYMVPGSTVFGNAVFFDKEEIGRPEYFNPDGGNQIILSSQGGDMDIQFVSIVMIYWE
jgi:hypothetical protein